ncbi:enoyl-CoA hydratase/isomerase family protein [Stackebrandtia nassauensis]|uniref:Enoyl-CoA hydratase/isomerase n=1 Tax=Stackebrandtia nassauensis (strain DSM 44728 / CIP 108903 / NRRL B-16338 / NBRC 102104 / LLR-40K-21) TaxID=446470 RepID=D3Q007_STANL|nr:enoyl-CoA hydratase/isomerase family protein [Stackebrandtia nassauensis]ADD45536.1 Enoyl-CoA hydratase/isomerase [Stackebrandtia nassauensis DSM 44728]
MSFSTLLVEERSDRLVVRLNRAAKRNAIDQDMVDELHAVCASLEDRPRLALFTGGADGIFAAGADIAQLRDRTSLDALRAINSALFRRIRALPLPTVAAIDGPALGGGAELAYACDIRVCTDRAVFGQPEVRLGIMAGAGATWRLPELVGESLAKELLFTGRRMDATEALGARLVSRVVAPEALFDTAHELLDQIAKASPLALRLTKLAVDAEGAHPAVDLAAQSLLFDDEDKHRRMTKFLDR